MLPGLTIAPEGEETIRGALEAIRQRKLSCVELLERCLARIDALEPQVRAWVVVDRERALETARMRDEDLKADRWRGLLHGIPIGIKDIIDVEGLPTKAGAPGGADEPAERDAPIVAKLREHGAIILGKTVTTPYAWVDPPPTANPWNLEHTPGGSSSGSAAALACGMCSGALGSQTGGSITRPASFCGVAGLKPTHGALSVRGVRPLAPSLDHPGPLARTVGDLAILWSVLAESNVTQACPAPPRLGRLRGMFETRAEKSALACLEHALGTFARAGAKIVERALPDSFEDVVAHHRCIMAYEAALEHRGDFSRTPKAYPPRIAALIEEGLAISAARYEDSLRHHRLMREQIGPSFEEVQVLVTPATLGPAPDRTTTGDPIFNSPWSYTGLPTISIPVALSPEGLPLAIQLIGHADQEDSLFSTALWCEDVLRRFR